MFRRILVPLDGSRVAETVLPQAVRLARLHLAEFWLLRVTLTHTALIGDPADAQVRAVHEAEVYLAALKERLDRDVSLHTAVRYGHAAEEIVDHATVNRVDTPGGEPHRGAHAQKMCAPAGRLGCRGRRGPRRRDPPLRPGTRRRPSRHRDRDTGRAGICPPTPHQ